MVQFTMVNGQKKALEKAKEFSCGKMDRSMKVIGNTIKLMDMDVSYMQMATVFMVIG